MEGFYYVSTQNAQLAQNSKVFEQFYLFWTIFNINAYVVTGNPKHIL